MLLTQTNWLKMPARELGSSFDAPNGNRGVGTTLLKRHKILPHPREERFPDSYPSTPANKSRDLVIDTSTSSVPSSDASSPRTLKHASKRIGVLPPTPPTHSRQSSGTHPIVPARKFDSPLPNTDAPSGPSTPPNQRSPPTPDVTPPRPARMPLAFRPPTTERYPSSRTDSFKTARENLDSDEDEVSTVRPVLPSAKTSAMEVPHPRQILPPSQKPQKRKEIGLGLGLESDHGSATTPKAKLDPSEAEFVIFDGEWGSTEDMSEVEREWDDNLMRNVIVRKRPSRSMHMFTDGAGDEVIEDDIVLPTNATKVVRSLPLQERIARHRLARDIANRTPAENFADRIAWPQPQTESESPSLPDRRFSTMSGRSVNSTVIEAMVVDAPPLRRKTLRHTKKQVALRDLGSEQSTRSSAPTSVASSEPQPQPRLHHPTAKLPERKHRSTTSSNGTASTTSSIGRARREVWKSGGIPVVVIPDRRSSSKSSRAPSLRSTSSRKTKRSMSVGSAPLSQSSKYNDLGYIDAPPPRKRTMSESAGSGHSVRTIDYPPSIPARRSSLSAPTSRNTSRAGSLTADSLKAHNMIQAKKPEVVKPKAIEQPHPAPETEKDTGNHNHRFNFDHNGDPFFGNRLSTQVTPFSQASYETAGTIGTMAEVSEAMAVSIYPHQNKSVLVVQHQAPSESTPPVLKALYTAPMMTVNGESTNGPVTPPQPAHPMDEVDSPLRNPRDPPEPPAIKFIPPTPAALTPSQEEEHQLGYAFHERPATSGDGPKRTISLMRRFSNRRPSETRAQRPGFLIRTLSLTGRKKDEATQTSKAEANLTTAYPSVVDRPPDSSKLHPFWRPAHFWDDLEDQEDEYDDEEQNGQYDTYEMRPNRTFSQKLKRTFAILPIQDDYEYQPYARDRRTVRRTPSEKLRVVKQRSNSSLRREMPERRSYTDVRRSTGPAEGTFGYGFKEGNGGRMHTIPGLGVRVEYVGWSGMKRMMSERRRQKRSEKLRASISGPKGVKSGMDDVLRRKPRV